VSCTKINYLYTNFVCITELVHSGNVVMVEGGIMHEQKLLLQCPCAIKFHNAHKTGI